MVAETGVVPAAMNGVGANALNEQIKQALGEAHDHAIGRIDEMITKLQSVKGSLEMQKKVAIERVQDFIGSIDKGLVTVDELDKSMLRFVTNHIDTPAAKPII